MRTWNSMVEMDPANEERLIKFFDMGEEEVRMRREQSKKRNKGYTGHVEETTKG